MAALTVAAVRRLPSRRALAGLVVVGWVIMSVVLHGRDTLTLGGAQLTPLHAQLNHGAEAIDNSRNSNPFFLYFINYVRLFINDFVTLVQALISQPSFGRPVPLIGWLGVTGIATAVAFLYASRRAALLTAGGFVAFGLLGVWEESMDTLALTLASVVLSLLIGIPLGVWAGLSDRFNRFVTPVLDFMQTMPTLVYLGPLTLFFLIGPASATVATMIYAIPPAIRITAYGIRQTPVATLEASTSLGATAPQSLRKVRLPLAKHTIVVGINQTIMAALSMATIAALIDAPGLGKTVLKALEILDVGTAFNAGLAIVIMAVVLDRVTSAAGRRAEAAHRSGRALGPRARRAEVALVLGAAAVLVYLSYTYVWAAEFPVGADLGSYVRRAADGASGWSQDSLVAYTDALKNAISTILLNPFQALLAGSPWWLVAAAVVALSALAAGVRAAFTAAVGVVLLVLLGLWQDSMVTLTSTLVATLLVMVLGVVFGVWMGRSDRVDQVLRPFLDAGQTMPAFVYLVPILGLFGATRLTAIIAAVVFAAPVSIKLVAEGIRGVSPTAVEAATAGGSSSWQLICKVQLPMARAGITLAAGQGLIYVLSMVVVGGLVGAGALGYDVVAGFSQDQLRGKGLAAGLAIVVLGIVLERVMRTAAQRTGRRESPRPTRFSVRSRRTG